jgi:hypothetical protein
LWSYSLASHRHNPCLVPVDLISFIAITDAHASLDATIDQPMSDADVDLQYSSPRSSPTESRASTPDSHALPIDIVPPLSPRSTLNILAGLPDLDAHAKTILAGLARGMALRDDNHQQEHDHFLAANSALQYRFDNVSCSLLAYEAMGKQDGPPEGYEPNEGHITRRVPMAHGLALPVQWVHRRPDGHADVLAGIPEEDAQCPYIMELFAPPNPHPGTPTDPLPLWFHKILMGNKAAYHTLHSEVSRLPSWEHLAEVECFRALDDRQREISDELAVLSSEHVLVEDRLSSCRHRLEAANTPALVAHLEGRELYH